MFCLFLAVLLLFHTNFFSFSFLLNIILIFTNKSQGPCLFSVPLAFVFTPWPDPTAVNGAMPVSSSSGYSPRRSSADCSGRKTVSEHSKFAIWSYQNEKVLHPFKQGHPNESTSLSRRFIEKLKEGSRWRQDRIRIFPLAMCSSDSTGWKRNWHITEIPVCSFHHHLEWSIKITKTVTGDILKQHWNSRKQTVDVAVKTYTDFKKYLSQIRQIWGQIPIFHQSEK